MIQATIIDDETGSRASLTNLIDKYTEGIDLIGEADGVETGLELISDKDPDLLFLDIRMRDGTGFQLLERLEKRTFQVIFTTAYDEYALRAFRFSAIDYLLKPINLSDLQKAISKAKSNFQRGPESKNWSAMIDRLLSFDHKNPSITVSTDDSIEFVDVHDIVRLESSSSYTTLFLRSGRNIVSSKTLRTFEDLLIQYGFFRCHQSHLVNLSDVERFIRKDGGHLQIKGGDLLPLARRRRDLFFELKQNKG